jgi:hypothetical protein
VIAKIFVILSEAKDLLPNAGDRIPVCQESVGVRPFSSQLTVRPSADIHSAKRDNDHGLGRGQSAPLSLLLKDFTRQPFDPKNLADLAKIPFVTP